MSHMQLTIKNKVCFALGHGSTLILEVQPLFSFQNNVPRTELQSLGSFTQKSPMGLHCLLIATHLFAAH
jgi:hypothetical protein